MVPLYPCVHSGCLVLATPEAADDVPVLVCFGEPAVHHNDIGEMILYIATLADRALQFANKIGIISTIYQYYPDHALSILCLT